MSTDFEISMAEIMDEYDRTLDPISICGMLCKDCEKKEECPFREYNQEESDLIW